MASQVLRGTRAIGCLVGGAVGDALGAPVEFLDLAEIRRQYGMRGILELDPGDFGIAPITDDTQMVMFTAEGLLETRLRERSREESAIAGRGTAGTTGVQPVLEAYHRWLMTQGSHPETGPGTLYEGMSEDAVAEVLSGGNLVHLPRLHARRSPGNTCLASLQTGVYTTPESPQNNSKGCGGLMRAAPAGIIAADPISAFRLGCSLAALTHGHPSGYISAAVLALLVFLLLDGKDLATAAATSVDAARQYRVSPTMPDTALPGGDLPGDETAHALEAAIELADSGAPVRPETVERLGGGWVAEEALAIGLYAALVYPGDVPAALRLAVNHSGDSDSTGSICGNIVGAMVGFPGIPASFCEALELKREVRRLAIGLNDARGLTAQA
jgi:ADP-ribosyl-[dinitrogen reductase] hydrolase